MLQFLKKPYPFNNDLKHNVKVIFFICVGVSIILFLFQPFDLYELEIFDKINLIIGLAIIIFVVLSFNLLLLPSLFPKVFGQKPWNIQKEIIWNLWLLLTISSGIYFYFNYLNIFIFDFEFIFKIILYSFIPISILITINQDRLLRSNLKTAVELNKKLQDKKEENEIIIDFISDYSKDSLSVELSSILLIRSANNYIEVFWKKNEKIQSQMIRSSLKKTQKLLSEYKFIFKCHRSYIINTKHIDKIEGHSQGYKLFVEDIDFPIPVSQNYTSQFQELI